MWLYAQFTGLLHLLVLVYSGPFACLTGIWHWPFPDRGGVEWDLAGIVTSVFAYALMNGIMSAYSFVAWGRPAAKWPLRIANLLAFAASLVAIVCFAATKNFSAGGNADTLWKLYLAILPILSVWAFAAISSMNSARCADSNVEGNARSKQNGRNHTSRRLVTLVQSNCPAVHCELDRPNSPAYSWWLDVILNEYWMIVEWLPDRGFGLSAGRVGEFGEGADEVYPDLGSVSRRVFWLLEHRGKTAPQFSDQLRQLRVQRRLTQEDLAQRLHVQQSSVSKLEGRGETTSIRKVQEFVAAMGGQLSLRVSFPDDQTEEELTLGQLRTGSCG